MTSLLSVATVTFRPLPARPFFESTSLQHQETLNKRRPVKKLPTDMPVPLGLQL